MSPRISLIAKKAVLYARKRKKEKKSPWVKPNVRKATRKKRKNLIVAGKLSRVAVRVRIRNLIVAVKLSRVAGNCCGSRARVRVRSPRQ